MRRIPALPLLLLACYLLATPAAHAADRYFRSSDGVRLHYIEAGKGPHTLVMVPGWTMPAWIFEHQIRVFSRYWRVVAFDPRAQGASAIAPGGYTAARRGQDIAELIAHLGPEPVVLLGWSLGVLDSLAYVHAHGDRHLAGLVLVDNSVGEEPPPTPSAHPRPHRVLPREQEMRRFVASMFVHPPPRPYLARLTDACLHTPPAAASALLAYAEPRSYWREAVYAASRPLLYIVRPRWAAQAANLAAHRPDTETIVMHGVGHALFVDDAARFDASVESFLRRRVWP
jgi:microsomal epoxide hydrolase